MPDMTPRQTIAAAYRENDGQPSRQDERLGATYRHSEEHEKYAALAESDREKFDQLPRTVRMATGHYVEARDAAKRTGQA